MVNGWHSFLGIKTCLTLKLLLFAVNHTDPVPKTCKTVAVYQLSTLNFIVTQALQGILQFSTPFLKDERVTYEHGNEDTS